MTACGKAVCLGLTIVFFLTGVLIAVVIVTKEGNGSHQNGQSKESTHNICILLLFLGKTTTVTIRQSWSQEPQGLDREAALKLPQVLPTDGSKLPLVVDLHGNGGQGNLRRLSFLGDEVVVVAPNGYQRSWNVFNEKSKADDVSFIVDLINKVVAENSVVDGNDVTILGTSNGAAMIYRLLLETNRDRPFHR